MWPTMRATDKSARGRLLAVIVALVPIRVGHDGLPADFIERDLLRAVPRRASRSGSPTTTESG